MWSIKELEKLNEELKLEPDQLQVYFDASFHKETGDSGLGVVVYYKLGEDAYRLRKISPSKESPIMKQSMQLYLRLSKL